jgi:predicted acyl esterase
MGPEMLSTLVTFDIENEKTRVVRSSLSPVIAAFPDKTSHLEGTTRTAQFMTQLYDNKIWTSKDKQARHTRWTVEALWHDGWTDQVI